ncbi:hypothetical protein SY89_03207 [Halolamina pelagica]|uniref:Uncharacterized protein n=2 Tax=Halolamina pelagica TaxID=699431 RepID=A0A0P7HX67_9EURY|nr:hypothetical protein SY89_03207 [Halolamina pelagica]
MKRSGQAMTTDSGGYGTIGSYGYRENDDTIFFLTASHTFGQNDGGDKYENMTQGDDEMGFVQYQNESQDWAAVAIWLDKESMVDEPLIQRSGKSSKLIHGHYTEDGIDLIAANNGDIYRQGRSTGYQEGKIANVNQSLTGGDINHREAIEYNTMPSFIGDSGGPVFADSQASNGSVSILGFHSAGEGDGNSTACYKDNKEGVVTPTGYASPAFFAHREKSIWFGAGHRDSTY